MPRKKKRVVIIGDLHCGHVAGIAPPHYTGSGKIAEKTAKLREQCWKWFMKEVKKLGTVDVLIVNGDAIDGRGERSGSRELLCVDRMDQVGMATMVINQFKAKKIFITYGTGYHTGNLEDFENLIADNVGAQKIGSHLWIDVNGIVFDCKHHVGSSGIPHGRHTAISKERLWNLMWKEQDEQPGAQVYIRSHVHYVGGAFGANWLGMTMPALQAAASIYGARRCNGTVDYGFCHFDVDDSGIIPHPVLHCARIPAQKQQVDKA